MMMVKEEGVKWHFFKKAEKGGLNLRPNEREVGGGS